MTAPVPISDYSSYRNVAAGHYTFCPGCGHSAILDHLHAALLRMQVDPHQVVIVSDIGCVGMADPYFATHTFHGLHGRSIAYACGIKATNPGLQVLVLIGDGGCGIGGHHLINAARRNMGITVLVFNNLNFGMTGGQHSVTTPHGARTTTTRGGNLERPLDIGALAAVSGASYVYRGTSFDKDLPERIAEAASVPGFALLDIWELCTAYYVPNNGYSRSEMVQLMSSLGMQSGVLHRGDYPEWAAAYREQAEAVAGQVAFPREPVAVKFKSRVRAPTRIVLAGAAGGKVKSTASLLATAAMRCGLWCTQRDDYPVTVMSGHSISEVILAPQEVLHAGIERPDVLAILTPEGLGQVLPQLAVMQEDDTVYVESELAARVQTRARKVVFRPMPGRANRKTLALMALAAMLRDTGLVPLAALEASIRAERNTAIVAEQLKALEQGEELTMDG